MSRDEKKLEYLRKWIVNEKIQSQLQLFNELIAEPRRYYNSYNKKWQVNNNQNSSMNYSLRVNDETKMKIRRATEMMEVHFQKIPNAHDLREIMRVEADVGKLYYPTFSLAFRPELEFHSRNSRRTYRPADATDVLNALLNYGFSILYAEVAKQLTALGLDCFVGYYHKNHESRLPLVYDMIEPFRHLVDRSVFEIQYDIKKGDCIFSRKGIVVLPDSIKSKYISLLSFIFDRKRDYKARLGIRRADGYQKMEEITIMKMKCIELRDFIQDKKGNAIQMLSGP